MDLISPLNVAVSAFNVSAMKVILGFDKKRDIREVSQNGFVDLASAYKNGIVPSNASESDLSFGNIESPNNIAGRPHDAFEAMRMNKAFAEHLSNKESGMSSVTPPAE